MAQPAREHLPEQDPARMRWPTIPCWSRDCVDYVRRATEHVLPGAWDPTLKTPQAGTTAAINKDVLPP